MSREASLVVEIGNVLGSSGPHVVDHGLDVNLWIDVGR